MISTALWLDAADASTITESSGAVNQWNDKSGNRRNFAQATSGNRPAYASSIINNKPVIRFDGSNDVLTAPDFLGGSGYVSFVGVGAFRSLTSTNQRLVGVDAAISLGGQAAMYILVISSGNVFSVQGRRVQSDSIGITNQSSAAVTTPVLLEGINDYVNTDQFLRVNGSIVASNTNFQTSGTLESGLLPVHIGARNDALAPATLDLGELLCFTTDPGTSTRQRIEGYLAHKWGLTANLPSDHPYKTVGPTP